MLNKAVKLALFVVLGLSIFVGPVHSKDIFFDAPLTIEQNPGGFFVPNFLCYRYNHQLDKPAEFNVTDQFGTMTGVKVEEVLMLCEPAAKIRPSTDEDQGDPPKELPITCYKISNPGRTLDRRIALTDQFATDQRTTVLSPKFFCDPTKLKIKHDRNGTVVIEQAKPRLSHFTCYEIEPLQIREDRIRARDQFGVHGFFTLSVAELLCEVAQKWHRGERQPRPDRFEKAPVLKCYHIKPDQAQPLDRRVVVADQFDFMQETVMQPVLFCDRALKELLAADTRGAVSPQPLSLARVEALGGSYPNQVLFQAQGGQIEQIQVQVFSLAGQTVYDSGVVAGRQLSWNLLGSRNLPVANGVYLYVLTARGTGQSLIRSGVKKLVVLR